MQANLVACEDCCGLLGANIVISLHKWYYLTNAVINMYTTVPRCTSSHLAHCHIFLFVCVCVYAMGSGLVYNR